MVSTSGDNTSPALAEKVKALERVVAARDDRIELLQAELGLTEDFRDTDGPGLRHSVTDWISRRSPFQTLGVTGSSGYRTAKAAVDPTGHVDTKGWIHNDRNTPQRRIGPVATGAQNHV